MSKNKFNPVLILRDSRKAEIMEQQMLKGLDLINYALQSFPKELYRSDLSIHALMEQPEALMREIIEQTLPNEIMGGFSVSKQKRIEVLELPDISQNKLIAQKWGVFASRLQFPILEFIIHTDRNAMPSVNWREFVKTQAETWTSSEVQNKLTDSVKELINSANKLKSHMESKGNTYSPVHKLLNGNPMILQIGETYQPNPTWIFENA